MARSFLAILVIALATLEIVTATYYCVRPKCPPYGGCKPYSSKYSVGSRVYFFCNDGYEVYGSSYATCLYSRSYKRTYWSRKPPICKPRVRQCPRLRLDYGVVKHSGFKPGAKALHICNKCFRLVGDKVRYCQKNGYWSGKPPVCKIIDCGPPPEPDYGKVIYRSTKCGSKAIHKCDRGFRLVGSKTRICLTNGYWSGRTPKCIRIKKKYY